MSNSTILALASSVTAVTTQWCKPHANMALAVDVVVRGDKDSPPGGRPRRACGLGAVSRTSGLRAQNVRTLPNKPAEKRTRSDWHAPCKSPARLLNRREVSHPRRRREVLMTLCSYRFVRQSDGGYDARQPLSVSMLTTHWLTLRACTSCVHSSFASLPSLPVTAWSSRSRVRPRAHRSKRRSSTHRHGAAKSCPCHRLSVLCTTFNHFACSSNQRPRASRST